MKKNILSVTLLILTHSAFSQTINWNNFDNKQTHIFNANIGAEHGLVYGIGYGYKLKSKLPIVLNAEYSEPAGNTFFDDFKTKLGVQISWFHQNHFYVNARIQGVFRRYQNSYARLLNFGSDLAVTAGYYKHKWFVAGETGFDKAIVTHFKHSTAYKQNFPGVQDGWYETATGGNFYFGVQGGCSFKRNDVYLKLGKITEQDFKTNPLVPVYAQLGYNVRF